MYFTWITALSEFPFLRMNKVLSVSCLLFYFTLCKNKKITILTEFELRLYYIHQSFIMYCVASISKKTFALFLTMFKVLYTVKHFIIHYTPTILAFDLW